MNRARDQFQAAGARLTLIGQLNPRHATHFKRKLEIELPLLVDESLASYQAAGAKVATLGELLGPQTAFKGANTMRKEHLLQGRTLGSPAQLGGALIVLPDGSIPWSHMSQNAGDNATPEEILQAVRDAAGAEAA